MKNSLLLLFILIASTLQSCDERITPKTIRVETEPPLPPTPSTITTILTEKSWQYNEVLVRGGGKTVAQFSRPNAIGLSTDFAVTKVTYKKEGLQEIELKGVVNKGTWEISKDEKVLSNKDSNGFTAVFDVVTISKTKLEISITIKKGANTDADWTAKLKDLKLPETSSEYTVIFSFVPI